MIKTLPVLSAKTGSLESAASRSARMSSTPGGAGLQRCSEFITKKEGGGMLLFLARGVLPLFLSKIYFFWLRSSEQVFLDIQKNDNPSRYDCFKQDKRKVILGFNNKRLR